MRVSMLQYSTIYQFVCRNLCDRDHSRRRGKADTLANEAMKTEQFEEDTKEEARYR